MIVGFQRSRKVLFSINIIINQNVNLIMTKENV